MRFTWYSRFFKVTTPVRDEISKSRRVIQTMYKLVLGNTHPSESIGDIHNLLKALDLGHTAWWKSIISANLTKFSCFFGKSPWTNTLKNIFRFMSRFFANMDYFREMDFAKNLAMSFSRHLKTIAKLWSCEKKSVNIFKII